MSEPMVAVFSGLPGTGKSTLADLVAQATHTPAFAADWLLGALAPHGVITNLDRKVHLGVYFDLLERLVWRQLMLGQSAITDSVMNDDIATQWIELAGRYDAEVFFFECVCSDEDVHRSRLEGRTRGIPGWHEIGWDHVLRMRSEFPELTVDRVVLDAADPLEDNVATALRRIGASAAAAG